MKAWLRAACAVAVTALAAATASSVAGAHVVPHPTFLEAGSTATIALAGPNERDEPMTAFRVRVPADLRIAGAHGPDGWSAQRGERETTWSGGSLAPAAEATFHVELEAPPAPGPVTLEAQQLYPGGEVVSWDVALTVVPAAEEPPSGPGWAIAVAIALALSGITVAILAFAWYRRQAGATSRDVDP